MKDKQYKIQGKAFHQGEMTLGQDKRLLVVLGGRKINLEELTGTKEVINYLMEKDLIDDFIRVILKGETESIDINEIGNSQLMEIIDDFFVLNSEWIQKFGTLLSSFLTKMNLMTPSLTSKEAQA